MSKFDEIADKVTKIAKRIGLALIYTIMITLTTAGFFSMVIGTKQV